MVSFGVRLQARSVLAVAAAIALVTLSSCRPQPTDQTPPVVLHALMTDDWAETPAFLSAVREFEESNPGVRLEIEKKQIRLMAETVRSRVDNGDPPDVVQWHAFAAGAQGFAEPLEDLWAEHRLSRDEFFSGAVADVSWGDHLYGVPLDTNALVLFYRTADLTAANLGRADIDSFPDLANAAGALTSGDGSRRAITLPNSYWSAYGWDQGQRRGIDGA